jgi:ABC-type uncharacterized transport system auxiliary subunit
MRIRASNTLYRKQMFNPEAPHARALMAMIGLVLVFGLAGCGSTRPIKYYQVSYPSNSTVAPDALDVSIMVRTFESSHLYQDDKIVYGFESPEMGTYEYQRWSEPPIEILENALVRGLRASGRFRTVYTLRTDPYGRYILAGHLYDFKEVDGATMVARLAYEVRLRDRKSGVTVWEHTYSHDEPASAKTIDAFVEAMDKNLTRSVQEVQVGIEQYLRAHPPQS